MAGRNGGSRRSFADRFKWGLLSRTYIELYNYPHRFPRIRHSFYKAIRKVCCHPDRRVRPPPSLECDRYNLLILTFGGIGDSVMAANYIHHLSGHLGDGISITIADVHRSSVRDAIFGGLEAEGIDTYGMELEPRFDDFDMIVRIVRYPVVLKEGSRVIPNNLAVLVKAWKDFESSNTDMIIMHPFLDYKGILECISSGKKRFQQPDIGGIIGIVDLDYPMLVPDSDILEKNSLAGKRYITVNRDTGFADAHSTKLWPIGCYNELLAQFKVLHPEIAVVMVGGSSSDIVENVDVDLRGRTTLGELKVLLKDSLLHMSCEGLSVHIRHLVSGGPSVVLFGSTSADFYGYPENTNIFHTCSNGPCEWTTRDWVTKCPISSEGPICLASIKVDDVLSAMDAALSG